MVSANTHTHTHRLTSSWWFHSLTSVTTISV